MLDVVGDVALDPVDEVGEAVRSGAGRVVALRVRHEAASCTITPRMFSPSRIAW